MAIPTRNREGYSREQQQQDEFDLQAAGIASHGWDSQALAEELRGTGSFEEQRTNAETAANAYRTSQKAAVPSTAGSSTPNLGFEPTPPQTVYQGAPVLPVSHTPSGYNTQIDDKATKEKEAKLLAAGVPLGERRASPVDTGQTWGNIPAPTPATPAFNTGYAPPPPAAVQGQPAPQPAQSVPGAPATQMPAQAPTAAGSSPTFSARQRSLAQRKPGAAALQGLRAAGGY